MFVVPMKKQLVFTIRVIYKSGASMEFDCKRFVYKGSSYEWESVGEVRPIQFGADDVAAVWQLGQREIDVPADPNEGAQP